MIDFRLLISNEAVTTVKVVQIYKKTVKDEEEEKVGKITTTKRMKPPHIFSSDIIVNNLKDTFLLSTSTLWSEASIQNTWVVYQQHQTSASNVGGVVGLSF